MKKIAKFTTVLDLMRLVNENLVLLNIDNLEEYYVTFNFEDIYYGDTVGVKVDYTKKVIIISVNKKGE